jgi:hypothetical protein
MRVSRCWCRLGFRTERYSAAGWWTRDRDRHRPARGGGARIAKVEVGIDGTWRPAELDAPIGRFAWRGWRSVWNAEPGEHELSCRATDANGETQPLETRWDAGGFGNNVVHRVRVKVR